MVIRFFFISVFIGLNIAQPLFPMPNCLGKQFNGVACTDVACKDPRCFTCSINSISDCLLCDSNYKISNSHGEGSCLLNCDYSQLRTEHYNITSATTFSGATDVCLDKASANCSDPYCLSCLEGRPEVCLICNNTNFPRYLSSTNEYQCLNCGRAMINCLECQWNTYCTKCKSFSETSFGFLVKANGKGCDKCEDIYANCKQCNGLQTCENCVSGFFVNSTTNTCDNCISYCDTCPNSTICSKCKSNYFMESPTKCTACNSLLPSCLECSDNSTCTRCEEGFILNSTNQCALCNTVSAGLCLSCNGTHCTRCDESVSLLDSLSKSCVLTNTIAHCVATDGVACTNCSSGYYLSSSRLECLACPAECQECDGSRCVRCLEGRYLLLNNQTGINECLLCSSIPDCAHCDGLVCDRCAEDFLRYDNRTCKACGNFSNCAKCDGISCVLCNEGLFLTRDENFLGLTCENCSDTTVGGVPHCTYCWSQGYCRKCYQGYYLEADTAQCSSCFSERNCISCDGFACTECKTGYYLSLSNNCVKCADSNCQSCPYDVVEGQSICSECSTGYYLHPIDKICIPCVNNTKGVNCSECSYRLLTNYELTCLKCMPNYGVVLENGTCTECSLPFCETCVYNATVNKRLCTNCSQSYFLEENGTCTDCGLENCLSCTKSEGKSTCTECIDGFYLNTTSKGCLPCGNPLTGCSKCQFNTSNSEVSCEKCDTSFFLVPEQRSCISCGSIASNCYSCSAEICSYCNDGYYLRNPKNCSTCAVPYCSKCSIIDYGSTCIVCLPGYYQVNETLCSSCVAKIPFCSTCRPSLKYNLECLTCEKGYFLKVENNSTVCLPCPQNCEVCSNANSCLKCNSPYYLQIEKNGTGTCLAQTCPASQNIELNSNKTCIDCGFIFTDCASCNLSQCLSCNDGKMLITPGMKKCIQCSGDRLKLSSDGKQCGYVPVINMTYSFSLKTGLTAIDFSCGGAQVMGVYLVYYINGLGKFPETFDDVYNNLKNLSGETKKFTSNDSYWTNFIFSKTDSQGNLKIYLKDLKNVGTEYKIQGWCHNYGSELYPWDIWSPEGNLTWIQHDNGGYVIKLTLGFNVEYLNETSIGAVSQILRKMLNLIEYNRFIMHDSIYDSSPVNGNKQEVFILERDYSLSPYDTTGEEILDILNKKDFIKSFNDSLIAYKLPFQSSGEMEIEKINSTIKEAVPEFKSLDLTESFYCDNETANFSLEIDNTNGFIYLGFSNNTNKNYISWEQLLNGQDPDGLPLNGFGKNFFRRSKKVSWNWRGLLPGHPYTIFFGATNEVNAQFALKSTLHKLIFKTKSNKENIQQI